MGSVEIGVKRATRPLLRHCTRSDNCKKKYILIWNKIFAKNRKLFLGCTYLSGWDVIKWMLQNVIMLPLEYIYLEYSVIVELWLFKKTRTDFKAKILPRKISFFYWFTSESSVINLYEVNFLKKNSFRLKLTLQKFWTIFMGQLVELSDHIFSHFRSHLHIRAFIQKMFKWLVFSSYSAELMFVARTNFPS